MTETEYTRGNYRISTDVALLDLACIHQFLSLESYWAKNIPMETVKKSIHNSLCFGVYDGNAQIGFARLVTDKATFAYLADVFILESHRGRGLSKWLVEVILSHPDTQGLRRWMLGTKDAHGLYAQFGFTPLNQELSARLMQRHNPDVYAQGS